MLNSKISSLQENVLEHKQHINKLKKEFNEAYKREYDSEVCKRQQLPKMSCILLFGNISDN